MLEDELHQSAAGDTPPEPEAKESDAAVPAEETGSIPEKTTAAEPAEGDVPPEPPKWKKVLQTAKKVVLKLPYPYLIMRIVGCYFMVMAAFLLINRKEIRGGSLNPVEKWEEFVDKLAAAAGIALCACWIRRFDIAAASAETHLEKPLRTRRACDGCRCCGNGVPDDLENQQLLLCTGIYRGVHHYCMVRLSLRLVQDRGKAAESSDLYYHWRVDVPDGSIHCRVHHLPA